MPGFMDTPLPWLEWAGIALSPWMLRVACREAGRLAMLSSASSLIGVAA